MLAILPTKVLGFRFSCHFTLNAYLKTCLMAGELGGLTEMEAERLMLYVNN